MTPLRLSKCGQCAAALAFEASGLPRPEPTPEARKRMDLGAGFEALVLADLEAKGAHIFDRQRAVYVDGVLGHIDAIARWEGGEPELIEIKSMGANSWRDFTQNGIRFAGSPWNRQYYSQVNAYMHGLREDGLAVTQCRVVVAKRDDKSADPLSAPLETQQEILPYDEDEVARVRQRLNRIAAFVGQNDSASPFHRVDLEPIQPRDLREHTLDDAGCLRVICRWCDYKTSCWGELEEIPGKYSVRLMPRSETEF